MLRPHRAPVALKSLELLEPRQLLAGSPTPQDVSGSGGIHAIIEAADSSGDIFTFGSFHGSINFGDGKTRKSNAGSFDAFFAKRSPKGKVMVKTWGGTGDDGCTAAAIDPKTGNICVAGNFAGTSPFLFGNGTTNLTAVGSSDVYFQIFGPDLTAQAPFRIGGTGSEGVSKVLFAPNGDFLAMGDFTGTVDFDPTRGKAVMTSPAGQADEPFIARYKLKPGLVWSDGMKWNRSDFDLAFEDFTLTRDGAIGYVGGGSVTTGVTLFGSAGTLAINGLPADRRAGWVFRFDPSTGKPITDRTFISTIDAEVSAVATDPNGNLLIDSIFTGLLDADPNSGHAILDQPNSTSVNSTAIIKLDRLLKFVWGERIGASHYVLGDSILILPSGNLLIGGEFSGVGDFDPGSSIFNLTSLNQPSGQSGADGFIDILNPKGGFVEGLRFGGTFSEGVSSFARSPSGTIFANSDLFNTDTSRQRTLYWMIPEIM
jgi:WD40 repeat protein